MKLSEIRDALLEVTQDTYHYEATKKPDKYIVWAEDNEPNSGHGDNKKTIQVIQGTIDYFTREEFDNTVVLIQQKLNDINVSWRLNSIDYEEGTKYIHYEWVFSFMGELI